ncbi:MAG: hypothetical protein ACJ763_00235 [Bdellovibrionia bacterium]
MLRFKRMIEALVLLFVAAMSGQSASAAANSNQSDVCPESGQIDWSKVPGPKNNGPNDVTRDFMTVGDPLNDILSNDFTAWQPQQKDINGAFTSTGRAQRQAVLGSESKQVHGAKSSC